MPAAYTIVKQLLLPPGSLLLLLALAFLLLRGTLGRVVLFVAWSLFLIMSLPGFAYPLIGRLEQAPALTATAPDPQGAGAIVVLGGDLMANAPEYGGDTVGRLSLERVRYAAWLHRRTALPIYVTGGWGEHRIAPAMAQVVTEEFGVPVAGVEGESHTTWENATHTAPLLAAAGIRRVLLVTQAWHMPRSVAAFRQVGLEVVPAPTAFVYRPGENADAGSIADWLPQAGAFAASSYAVHEMLGQILYRLRETPAAPATAAARIH